MDTGEVNIFLVSDFDKTITEEDTTVPIVELAFWSQQITKASAWNRHCAEYFGKYGALVELLEQKTDHFAKEMEKRHSAEVVAHVGACLSKLKDLEDWSIDRLEELRFMEGIKKGQLREYAMNGKLKKPEEEEENEYVNLPNGQCPVHTCGTRAVLEGEVMQALHLKYILSSSWSPDYLKGTIERFTVPTCFPVIIANNPEYVLEGFPEEGNPPVYVSTGAFSDRNTVDAFAKKKQLDLIMEKEASSCPDKKPVCVYIGDGINDILAIAASHVGILFEEPKAGASVLSEKLLRLLCVRFVSLATLIQSEKEERNRLLMDLLGKEYQDGPELRPVDCAFFTKKWEDVLMLMRMMCGVAGVAI